MNSKGFEGGLLAVDDCTLVRRGGGRDEMRSLHGSLNGWISWTVASRGARLGIMVYD